MCMRLAVIETQITADRRERKRVIFLRVLLYLFVCVYLIVLHVPWDMLTTYIHMHRYT
jgi:hypothetical protein